jgi:hypothetical protein
MDDDSFNDSFIEMPEGLFDSVETGEPFRECIHCHCDLAASGRLYLVSKEIVHGECVLEYAICEQCRDELSDELSEESKERIQQMLEEGVDWQARFERTMEASEIDPFIETCIFCGAPRDEEKGYGLSGIFLGGQLFPGPLPAIICANCSERIQQLLSKKTRDFWDRFSEEHFPGPPADFVDLPSPHVPAVF